MKSILIKDTTKEEREEIIKSSLDCGGGCDMCGLCKVFHGKDAETAYDDYITGKRSYMEVSASNGS
ncbi:MAG: hypothetical protein IJJ59_05865 [Pseudobutyrivibrio sp.]|uniref:hypothetical protein n=1 Tax=Pseudobutyrivibrio sp. TaxID=2014367 RepID=UPI0025E03D47|nr:hypothetical protein [Pseudobutyrivibrio sp.]MBQ6462828.1 hypothetical protein [Pseudobutyrivibrio sp.]